MSAAKLTAAMAAYEESTRVPVAVSQEELIASLAQAVAASIWRQWHVELTDAQDDDLFSLVLVETQRFVARAFRYGDGLRAFRSGLSAKRKSIHCGARQGAEQVAVAYVSGIVSNAEDEQIPRCGRVRPQCPVAVLRPKIA